MAYRCIFVETPARLSVRNGQLVIFTQEEHTVSPEDVSAALLETRQHRYE